MKEQVSIIEDIEIATEGSETFYEVMDAANVDSDGRAHVEQGMAILLKRLLSNDTQRVSKKIVEDMVQEIDGLISKQVDAILHCADFKKLETAWRELYFMIERTDFAENISIDIISVSKEDVALDFEDNVEVINSGLYKKVYIEEYGQYGGRPYAAIISSYEFDKTSDDMNLLGNLASVSAMAHAPCIANVGAKFFGLNSMADLSQIRDLESELEHPRYKYWNELREHDDARNLGLCTPRFMLREPYGVDNPVRSFEYKETISNDAEYAWGAASFAFATRLTESFAQFRWCPNIIGPQSGGAVNALPTHTIDDHGLTEHTGPTETVISDRYEYSLSDLGFIPLAVRKGTAKACFFSASSIQKAKYFGNDEEAQIKAMNYRLGGELPYLFVVNRLAHYLKVLQRENLGSWKSRRDIEDEMNKWIRQYVSDQENPSPAVRSQRPLRSAKLQVIEDPALGAGWYKIDLAVVPHFKFMGANFTLFLESSIENQEQ